jgi:hypothetical protein
VDRVEQPSGAGTGGGAGESSGVATPDQELADVDRVEQPSNAGTGGSTGESSGVGERDAGRRQMTLKVGKPVDLLAMIDPVGNRIRGQFSKTSGALITSPMDGPGMIRIPFDPPQEYALSAEVTRLQGGDELIFGLLVGGRQVNFDLDGWHTKGNLSGLGMIDNKRADYPGYPDPYRGTVLQNGRTAKIVIVVQRDRVVVNCDGHLIQDWHGDPRRLSPFWSTPDRRSLFLGSYRTSYRISRLELSPLRATGDADEQPAPTEIAQRPVPPERTLADLAKGNDTVGSPSPPEKPVKRRPVPSNADRQEALQEVRDLLKSDYDAAKTSAQKLDLCSKLIRLANDSEDHHASHYVLIDEARRLAIGAGNTNKAIECAETLAKIYEADPSELRLDTLTQLVSSAKTPEEKASLAQRAYQYSRLAAASDDFERAAQLARVANGAATRARDINLRKLTYSWQGQLKDIEKQWNLYKESLQRLEENPEDAAAHLTVGKYLCAVKDDWRQALPHLSKCGDEKLAAAAKLDAAGPTEAAEQAKTGDAWWDAIETAEEPEATAYRRRCLMWYQQGLAGLAGLTKTRVGKRIAELKEALPTGTDLAGATDLAGNPSPAAPVTKAPGMIGRALVNGVDAGVLLRYSDGQSMSFSSLARGLATAGVTPGRMRLDFHGLLDVPANMELTIYQRTDVSGRNPQALYINGRPFSAVGGGNTYYSRRTVPFRQGTYQIRWTIDATNAVSSGLYINQSGGSYLHTYHTSTMLDAAKRAGVKAEINVD